MDRYSVGPHMEATRSSRFSSVFSRALPRRIRRRQESASFAGVSSSSIREDSGLSPEREREWSKTICCTPELLPRSDSLETVTTASTMSTRSSSYDSLDSPRFSSSSSVVSTPLPQNQRLQGWMYWARQDAALDTSSVRRRRSDPINGECFTKVYGVLRNEFLLLYKSDHNSAVFSVAAETPLVQIAVAGFTLLTTGSFLVDDPHGHQMELYLFDRRDEAALDRWEEAFEHAVELTESHFSSFDVKVEELSRYSMYHGSLHDLRAQRPSLRQSFKHKMTRLTSFRFSTSTANAEREVSI